VYLDAAGSAIVLLSLVWALVTWRRHAAKVRPARRKLKSVGPGAPSRAGSTRRARLMERMEERWKRRQEGDRRM
jgi:hypothetical protein